MFHQLLEKLSAPKSQIKSVQATTNSLLGIVGSKLQALEILMGVRKSRQTFFQSDGLEPQSLD